MTALMLDSQLPHVRILRAVNLVGMGAGECWPEFLQDVNAISDAVLFSGGQSIPPSVELIREFNLPCHAFIM
jgi:hypothetical protein